MYLVLLLNTELFSQTTSMLMYTFISDDIAVNKKFTKSNIFNVMQVNAFNAIKLQCAF